MATQLNRYSFSELQDLKVNLSNAYDGTVVAEIANKRSFRDTVFATWYLRKGSVCVEYESKKITAKAGEFVFLDPTIVRNQQFSKLAHLVSVRLDLRLPNGLRPQCPGMPFKWRCKGKGALLSSASAVCRAVAALDTHERIWRRRDLSPQDYFSIQSKVFSFVICWLETLASLGYEFVISEQFDQRLDKALNVLNAHEGIGPVPYEKLRAVTRLSRVHLDRLFEKSYGTSPNDYLNERSLASAKRLLVAGAHSIKEIAAALQFSDTSHFAKWFRRFVGTSPGQFVRGDKSEI